MAEAQCLLSRRKWVSNYVCIKNQTWFYYKRQWYALVFTDIHLIMCFFFVFVFVFFFWGRNDMVVRLILLTLSLPGTECAENAYSIMVRTAQARDTPNVGCNNISYPLLVHEIRQISRILCHIPWGHKANGNMAPDPRYFPYFVRTSRGQRIYPVKCTWIL